MQEIDNLKGYLAIDKYALDDELVRQASLFFQISEAFTSAAAERDALKEQLSYVYASLDMQVRHELGEKATEGKVKSKIQLMADHQEAVENYLQAKEKADKLQALQEAFKQRGYMLRDLAQLFMTNYFGTDAVRTTSSATDAVYQMRRAKMAAARKE